MEVFHFLINLFNYHNADIQVPILGIVPIIAAAISVAATAASAAAGASANKKNRRILDKLDSDNESEYLREYYRGALENEGSKAYLKRLNDRLRDSDKAAENSSVATGATHENALAKKESNNRVMSDAVAGLVQNEDNRKQQVKQNYLNRKHSLAMGETAQNSAVADNWANIGSGISSAAGSLASAYMDGGNWFGKAPKDLGRANTSAIGLDNHNRILQNGYTKLNSLILPK